MSAALNAWQIGSQHLTSRLIVGSGRFETAEIMRDAIAASGSDCVTVAVRRERMHDPFGRNLLDFLDLQRTILLPNTAGCYNAKDAVRVALLGREIMESLENPGARWVKLEVLGDSRTLLPDPIETLRATEQLVARGFEVLCYTNDDPMTALRLKRAGAVAVMPAGSPIGSGQGILNPNNIRICVDYLKDGDANYPVIVDAGIGTASDCAFAMELGVDGVLLNSAIAQAREPLQMAEAMKLACQAGWLAHHAGRIPKQRCATASSPQDGVISSRPWGGSDPPIPKHPADADENSVQVESP